MAPEPSSNDKEVEKWLKSEGYVIEGAGYMDSDQTHFINELYRVTDKRVETAVKLMGKVDWSFFMLLISGTDRIQHNLWTEMDGGSHNEMLKYYKHLDGKLKQLVEAAGADVVFLMSDHGFCSQRKRVHINHWLKQEGYLKLEDTPENRKIKTTLWVSGMLKKTGASKILVRFMQIVGGKPGKISPPKLKIDYAGTQAYTCGYYTGQIYLSKNMAAEEYEQVQTEIIGKLKSLRDPKTGDKIVEDVWRKQDVYHGEQTEHAPDILILPADGYWLTGGFSYPWLIEKIIRETGRHHMQGIYVASGSTVKKGLELDAHLIDLAPTILNLFGLKADMDGSVIDAFQPEK
jgi:predicted AlkP superfamily phosphohydrolase/phosphomutase